MAISKHRSIGAGGNLIKLFIIVIFIIGALPLAPAWAQDDEQGDQEEQPETQGPAEARARLFITATDTSTVPQVTLRAYGMGVDGRPLDLAAERLAVRHGGETADDVSVGGAVDVGTFTIFLLDITSGVDDQIPAIQQTIEQYAAPAYMREQMDQVAIYRVGAENASEALAPTGFYNSVRNFFSGGLEPQDGPTALIDSMVGLLNDMDNIRPDSSLAPAVVVFSDGTDAVSTQFEAEDVAARAVELGIPVHTVWLENAELTVGQEAGRNYLAQVAAEAYGVAGRTDQPDTITPILERISAFRSQQLVRYTPPSISPDAVTVELSLVNDPLSQDQAEVSINAASPTVTLTVPPDSRTLQLPDLDEAVRLALSAQVGWLDGQERGVQQARLLVNGQFVQDVPPQELNNFTAEVTNLTYGDNSLQLSVTDDQGIQAMSPEVVFSVVEGEQQIPEALQPAPALAGLLLPICAGLAALALLGVAGFFMLRGRSLPRFGRRGRDEEEREPISIEDEGEYAPETPRVPPPIVEDGPAQAYLEVLETMTQMPGHIPLQSDEIRLGRSPALADVAFEQDITVSRLHASILWDGHNYRIYDDDSTSGTWVNDQEVPDYGAQLFDGDDIFLGKVRLRFRQR